MRRVTMLIGVFFLWATSVWATTLENPAPGAIKSGVGLISGWACDVDELEISFDGGARQFVPYGSERTDTRRVCGDTDNGFGLLWNYNELGDGPHTVTLYADGIVATQVRFTVKTLGTNFLRGATGRFRLIDFPVDGSSVVIRWEEATQGFVITDYTEEEGTEGGGSGGGQQATDQQKLRSMVGTWDFFLTFVEPVAYDFERSYTVAEVQQNGPDIGAWGRDPLDSSVFGIIILDSPLTANGQRYPLFMMDVDDLRGSYVCHVYYLNPSGQRLTGVFFMLESHGRSINHCDTNRPLGLGTMTGRKR